MKVTRIDAKWYTLAITDRIGTEIREKQAQELRHILMDLLGIKCYFDRGADDLHTPMPCDVLMVNSWDDNYLFNIGKHFWCILTVSEMRELLAAIDDALIT